MVNGYLAPILVPFGRKVLVPDDVNIDDDTGLSATFNFYSPVYFQEGQDYCFVVLSNSLDYKIWISQMNEKLMFLELIE